MIVIVLRCHTGLTFDFLRFCFIFAKDVKYFEKWKWKVSKYLSSFFNFWSRLRIPRDMETLGVLILLILVPLLYQKKKKKTGLGNKSKFLFVFYNSVPHWWNIHLRGTPRVSLTRVSSLQEFKSTRAANLDHVSRRNSQTRAYFSCRTQYHLIPNFCNPVLS